jgi:hypothetical protein
MFFSLLLYRAILFSYIFDTGIGSGEQKNVKNKKGMRDINGLI